MKTPYATLGTIATLEGLIFASSGQYLETFICVALAIYSWWRHDPQDFMTGE